MKNFFKIGITITLLGIMLLVLSFPSSTLSSMGLYVFGSYYTYLSFLACMVIVPLCLMVIVFIWKILEQ